MASQSCQAASEHTRCCFPMLHAWVPFLCHTSLDTGMTFSNRLLHPIFAVYPPLILLPLLILLPIVFTCLDMQDVQAACAAVSVPVNVIPLSQGTSQVADYHQSAAGQHQMQLTHKPMNRGCVLVFLRVCRLWISNNHIASFAYAVCVVLDSIQWYSIWLQLQVTRAPSWRTSRLASSSA